MRVRFFAGAAALVVVLLLQGVGGEVQFDEEYYIESYLNCFRLYESYRHQEHRLDRYDPESFGCGMGLGAVRDGYAAVGRLPPTYLEALGRWFKGNQTLIHREIFSLDDDRASNDIWCPTAGLFFLDDDADDDDDQWPKY